jgi:hypothetical protein
VRPFLPAAFSPGKPRERLQGRSYRQRDDNPIRSICETSRRNRLERQPLERERMPRAEHSGDNAMRTSGGVRRKTSTRGLSPLPRQELQGGYPILKAERAELWHEEAEWIARVRLNRKRARRRIMQHDGEQGGSRDWMLDDFERRSRYSKIRRKDCSGRVMAHFAEDPNHRVSQPWGI